MVYPQMFVCYSVVRICYEATKCIIFRNDNNNYDMFIILYHTWDTGCLVDEAKSALCVSSGLLLEDVFQSL